MLFFAQDIMYFYVTIYGGLLIGLLFDFNRAIKNNFKIIRKLSVIFDVLFWVMSILIIFTTVNTIEFYDLRYYHFIALIIGFILYYGIMSRFVLRVLNTVITTTKSIITTIARYIILVSESLCYVFIYTIHFLMDIIISTLGIFFSKKKVIRKKSRN